MSKCKITVNYTDHTGESKTKLFNSYNDVLLFFDSDESQSLWDECFGGNPKAAPIVRFRRASESMEEMDRVFNEKSVVTSSKAWATTSDDAKTFNYIINQDGSFETEAEVERRRIKSGYGVRDLLNVSFTTDKGKQRCLKGRIENTTRIEFNTHLKSICPTGKNITDFIRSWERLCCWKMDMGTYVHNCMEAMFNNMEQPTPPAFLKINDDLKNSVWRQIGAFKKRMIEFHGENSEFITEKDIVSKSIPEALKGTLTGLSGTQIDCIHGKIDLLVFSEKHHGRPFVYDFKVSEREFSNWTSGQGNNAALQTLVYCQILKQWGIDASPEDCYIIPIELRLTKNDGLSTENPERITIGGQQPSLGMRFKDEVAKRKILSWLPVSIKIKPSTLDVSVTDKIKTIFPPELLSTNLAVEEKVAKTSINDIKKSRFWKKIKVGSDDYNKGFRYILDLHGTGITEESMEGTGIVADFRVFLTEENADAAIARFIEKYEELRKEEFANLGETIERLCETQNEESFKQYIDRFRGRKETYGRWLRYSLAPYALGGWRLVSDSTLIKNGFFIFKKTEGGEDIYDIVMMTRENLSRTYNFNNPKIKTYLSQTHATTVAGAFFYDEEVDNKHVLQATKGNMLLMKAMAYITANKEVFTGSRIRAIKAMNIENRQLTQASNAVIQSSWLKIMEGAGQIGGVQFDEEGKAITEGTGTNKKTVRKKIKITGIADSYFMSDAEACLSQGREILSLSGDYEWLLEKIRDEGIEEVEDQIDALLEKLGIKSSDGFIKGVDSFVDATDRSVAAQYLYRGLLARYKKYLMWEQDISSAKSQIVAPALSSKSANQRIVNDLMGFYVNQVRKEFMTYANKWRKLVLDCFKEQNRNAIQNESNWFKQVFFKDEENMILYDLDTFGKRWGTNSATYKLMEYFQNVLSSPEISGISEDDESMPPTYVPLVKGTAIEKLFGENIKDNAKDTISEFFQYIISPISNEMQDPDLIVRLKDDADSRSKYIEKHGVGYYSYNLDFIFLHTLQQQVRRKWQHTMSGVFAGVTTVLAFMNDYEAGQFADNKMENLRSWVNDYVNAKFKGESLIQDHGARQLYALFNKLVGFTSGIQLMLNSRAMIRETLTSLSIGSSRAFVKLLPGITSKTYLEAVERVLGSKDKLDLDGMLYQQNAYFGMANMDLSALGDAVKTNRWNFFNFRTRTFYITSSLPDLYFRNILLTAMFIGDGTDEAYGIQEDGSFGYNFKKDKRFEILKTKGEGLSGPRLSKYREAISVYNRLVDDINNRLDLYTDELGNPKASLKYIVFGQDIIPELYDGYTQADMQSIRNYADFLYGHYNDENKMMIQERFFGHFLMQYRTFLSSRVEQSFNAPGATNIVRYRRQENEQGKELYVVNRDGEVEITDEVSDEDIKNGIATPYMQEVGLSLPGTFNSLASTTRAIIRFKEHPEELKRFWAKEANRAIFAILILDNFVTMLAMALLNLLIGEEKVDTRLHRMDKEGWLKRWSYGVIMGSLQDGPIWKIIGQVNSLNPPSVTQLSSLWKKGVGVITGDDNFWHATIDSFGMTREFSHYFDFD